MSFRSALRLATAVAAVSICVGFAAAQNLVTNGDFDSGTDGWQDMGQVVLSWDPSSDYRALPESGSAEILNADPGVAYSGAVQCVDGVVGGESYDLSLWIRAPTGQSTAGDSGAFVWWYPQAGCTGAQGTGQTTPWFQTSDSWVELDAGSAVAPAGTHSAHVYLFNNKWVAGGQYAVWYDHVVLKPTGTVFFDGFESGGLTAWTQIVP